MCVVQVSQLVENNMIGVTQNRRQHLYKLFNKLHHLTA